MIAIGSNEPQVVEKKYVGYVTATVAAVNPDADRLYALLGHTWEKAVYTGKTSDGADFARVNFWLRPETELPMMPLAKLSVMLVRQGRKNSDGTKTQVIDKYGNTAWVTDDEFRAQAVPVYSNGKPATIIPPYQMACRGQERLVEAVKAWCNVPFSFKWDEERREFVRKDDEELKKCECELDIKRLWSGDVSEIADLVDKLSGYKVKALLTIRKYVDSKGAQRTAQSVYEKIAPDWRGFDAIGREFQRDSQFGGNRDAVTLLVPAVEYTPDNIGAAYGAVAAQAAGQPADMPPFMAPAQQPQAQPAPAAYGMPGQTQPQPAAYGMPGQPCAPQPYGAPQYGPAPQPAYAAQPMDDGLPF